MAKLSITADLVTLSAGSLILATLSRGLFLDGSVGGDLLLDGRHQHLLQGILGASLVLWPIVRRLVCRMCDPADTVEFADLTLNLRKIGLSNRVVTINRYLAENTDDAWRSVFPTLQDLWDWLGEAYQDADLRSQMHPKVALRTEEAGFLVGSLDGGSAAG